MSQSATLYPIDSNDFLAIQSNTGHLDIPKERENYVTFHGTHEGLRFILSKGQEAQTVALVNEIFYPATCIGEVSQYAGASSDEEAYEFTSLTDDERYEDFDREPILYLDQAKVKQIALLLNSVSIEQFSSRFDAGELNRENIYPLCWNAGKDAGDAYNERHIVNDFQNLKELFNRAQETNSYLLCFVG